MNLVAFRRAGGFIRCLLASGWTLEVVDTGLVNDDNDAFTMYDWSPPAVEPVAVCPECVTRNAVLLDQLAESQAKVRDLELRLTSMVRGARGEGE